MSRDLLAWGAIAVGCHALLLFGLRIGQNAVPLPMADAPMEVSLVASAPPAEPAPVVELPPPVPPPPEPEPPPPPEKPEPMVGPLPEPTPEPQPAPVATPKPVPRRIEQPRPSAAARSVVRAPSASSGATGGLVTARPRYRFNPKPEYPAEARRLKQQGRVMVAVEVNAEGRPTSVTLKSSCGFPALDAAALSAVRRWSFEPARAAGVPVTSRVEVPVQFAIAP